MPVVTEPAGGRGPYEVRLSGSPQNIITFGVVAFLRERRVARAVAGFAGGAMLLGGLGLMLFRAFLFEFERLASLSTPLLVAGFVLTFAAVLSSPRFNLILGDVPEIQERKEAEESLGHSQDPFSSLELDSKRLSEYYAINQSQARGTFRWAVFAMFCGLSTIVGGVWVFYLRSEVPDTFMTSLSTAAGLVVNVISGLYLYLHNRTQRRSLFYYGQLVRIQQLGLAIRLAEAHAADDQRSAARNKIIDELLTITRLTADRDTAEASR